MRDTGIVNFNLDCSNLRAYARSEKLYHQLLRYPQEVIPLMDHTATELFLDMFDDADLQGRSINVRPFNFGHSVNMRSLNPSDIDRLVTIKGLVIRSSPVVPDLKEGVFDWHCRVRIDLYTNSECQPSSSASFATTQ